MRLVDADYLIGKSDTVGERPTVDNPMAEMYEVVYVSDIENAPTYEPTGVIQAHWIGHLGEWACSYCKGIQEHMSNFCPRCGAKMVAKDIEVVIED